MKRLLLGLSVLVLFACMALPSVAEEYAVAPEDSLIHEALTALDYEGAADLLASQLPLKEKVCQLMIVTPETLSGEALTTRYSDLLEEGLQSMPVGGVMLFGQNIASGPDLLDMNERMDSLARRGYGIGLFLIMSMKQFILLLHPFDFFLFLGGSTQDIQKIDNHHILVCRFLKNVFHPSVRFPANIDEHITGGYP